MMMDNILVLLFLSLPFLVFLGLKLVTYQRSKRLEDSEEVNTILKKHVENKVFEFPKKTHTDTKDKNKAA